MDESTRRMRVVGYARRSSHSDDNGDSIAGQRRRLSSWARSHGHRLVEVHVDEGVSGTLVDTARPGLSAALDALSHGEGDALVVTTLDRLSRKLTVQEAALGRVWQAGASVFTVDVGEVHRDDPDDPMRTAMRQMMGVFAELERGMVTARMRRGKQAKREAGEFVGGQYAYGQVGASHSERQEAERAIVGRVHELRAGGASYRDVCATLTAEGYQTRGGGPWQPAVVRRIAQRA